jgi:hypothetical protein
MQEKWRYECGGEELYVEKTEKTSTGSQESSWAGDGGDDDDEETI